MALEMTPMIDVVFLLLIFFMLATTFDNKSGIKLIYRNLQSGKKRQFINYKFSRIRIKIYIYPMNKPERKKISCS